MWHTMRKELDLWIIGIDKGEEFRANGIDQNFNKIIEENFLKFRKDTPIQI